MSLPSSLKKKHSMSVYSEKKGCNPNDTLLIQNDFKDLDKFCEINSAFSYTIFQKSCRNVQRDNERLWSNINIEVWMSHFKCMSPN